MSDAEAIASGQVDSSVLTWTEEAIGNKLLAYLMGCSTDALSSLVSGDTPTSTGQISVLRELIVLRGRISLSLSGFPVKEIVSHILTQVGDTGISIARSLRLHAIDTEEIPVVCDDMERALVALALDAYPAFLLPPEADPPSIPMRGNISFRVVSLLHQHPQAKAFSESMLQDSFPKDIFAEENERTGYVAMVYRNTGSGSSLQLAMIPDMVLHSAWRRPQGVNATPETFAKAAVEELRLVRDVLEGKNRSAVAKLVFAGVLLPPGIKFDIGNGIVRAVTEEDRQLAPESLKGKLSGIDQSGMTTIINYDGDVLFEYKFPYKTKVVRMLDATPPSWPKDMLPPPDLERASVRLRFSLMLAVEREQRAQLVCTWRRFDEPLSQGYAVSWNDPRQGTGIVPMQLTESEVAAWRDWYYRLDINPVARIELALTRILRASAERREPSDVLIDSVIAWENLFGTKEGEPTFRVTMCIAKLLTESTEARLELKSKLGKIYALRSKVVHGSANLKDDEYPLCQEALEVAIRTVKVLVADRTDILQLSDGSLRSATLLLGD